MTMPVLFVSHGAPDIVILNTPASHFIRGLAGAVPAPKAILIMSAHWETQGLEMSLSSETIHDFQGFPRPLYDLKYTAPVALNLADRVEDIIHGAGQAIRRRLDRGRDHGAWAPLLMAYGAERIPTIQMSLPRDGREKNLMSLGSILTPLRDEGVLIIGSGSLTHNLGAIDLRNREASTPPDAMAFVNWVDDTLNRRDVIALQAWRTVAPYAMRHHPTPEHFLPLLFAAGAAGMAVPRVLHDSWDFGSLSMRTYGFGMPENVL